MFDLLGRPRASDFFEAPRDCVELMRQVPPLTTAVAATSVDGRTEALELLARLGARCEAGGR